MIKKAGVITIAVCVMWGLKRHYSDARPEDLWWILSPTSALVGLVTGTEFAFEPGQGYLSRERLFLIEKSCAGINFMIAAVGMIAFALRSRANTWPSSLHVLGLTLAASYVAAVIVNAARITIAMWLAARPTTLLGLSAAQLHRFEGTLVYFGGLLLLYELLRQSERTTPCDALRRP